MKARISAYLQYAVQPLQMAPARPSVGLQRNVEATTKFGNRPCRRRQLYLNVRIATIEVSQLWHQPIERFAQLAEQHNALIIWVAEQRLGDRTAKLTPFTSKKHTAMTALEKHYAKVAPLPSCYRAGYLIWRWASFQEG